MKKKIGLYICVLIAVFGLAGCSDKQSGQNDIDTKTMQSTAETLVTSFSQMDDESFAQLKQLEDLSDFQLEVQMLNLGLNVSGENFLNIIRSWEAAEAECGEYVRNGDYIVDMKDKEVTISTLAEFKERKATISFTFNHKGMLESMDVSAKYDTGEILTKAGLNTLLGMGVVFAVLIFLAFVIGLMKYIPMLLSGKKNGDANTKKPKAQADEPLVAAITAATQAATDDDLELIAVITAAIAMEEGGSPDNFVVRSIRRRPLNQWK